MEQRFVLGHAIGYCTARESRHELAWHSGAAAEDQPDQRRRQRV